MTEYKTKWDGSIKTIDATVNAKKKMQAGVEAKNYEFGEIPESDYLTCIDKKNDAAYVLLRIGEGAKQEIGCSCPYFKENRMICEHLYALRDIDVSKLETSPNWLVEFLQVDNDWHIDDNHRLVPPSTGSEKVVPEVVASVPPIDAKPEEPPKKEKKTCPHCNLTMPASRYEQHLSVCKKNPAKQKPQGSPTVEPPKKKESPRLVTQEAPVIPPDPEIDIGVDIMTNEPIQKTTAIQTTEPQRGFLTAAVSLDDAIAAFSLYNEAKTRLLSDNDVMYIGAGGLPVKKDSPNATPYLKKSAWRKMARFFGLSVDIIGREKIWVTDEKDEKYYIWTYMIKISHPCGAYVISEGVCTSRDKFFTKGGKVTADEKNVMLKAQTVGINRGISDLLGSGEVSAEEME